MNWLQSIWGSKKDTTLWRLCEKCEQMEYIADFEKNLHVCHHCGHHHKMSAKSRLDSLFGHSDNYKIIPHNIIYNNNSKSSSIHTQNHSSNIDKLGFIDTKSYSTRLTESTTDNNFGEAITICTGILKPSQLPQSSSTQQIQSKNTQHTHSSIRIVSAIMDFSFIGGSMGTYVGNAITYACELAISENLPLIIFTSSGGARIQEGIYALLQMPRTVLAMNKLKQAGLLSVVVLCNPTMGGVFASFATQGQIILAEPGATIGFTGQRVLANTTKEEMPVNFQTSEFQYQYGQIDRIIPRSHLNSELIKLITLIKK